MSTYQDRAKLVLEKHFPIAQVKSKSGDTKAEKLMEKIVNAEVNAVIDQALSELASIVEEEIIGEDEPGKKIIDLGSEFSTPRDYKRNARNHLRQEQRDQLSNRRGDGHTN